MNSDAWLVMYCQSVVVFSLLGGCAPLFIRRDSSRLHSYVSLACGIILGTVFFHLIPDAVETSGKTFSLWMSIGVTGPFCIKLLHILASPQETATFAKQSEQTLDAAPGRLEGWGIIVYLTLFTFMSGWGLAGSLEFDISSSMVNVNPFFTPPGMAMFLVVSLMQAADALVVSIILGRVGTRPWKLSIIQLGFALAMPAGMAFIRLASGVVGSEILHSVTGAALGVSAGVLLIIVLSYILPEFDSHRHGRIRFLLFFLVGFGLMNGITFIANNGELTWLGQFTQAFRKQ